MKRIKLPKEAKAKFIHSFPEAGHACMAAETWLKDESNCLVLLSDSIASSEEWGEDLIRLAEMFSPQNQFLFHLFDEIPETSHPEAFERNCERANVLSLLCDINERSLGNTKLILATTPEALRSPCQVFESKEKTQIKIEVESQMSFSGLIEKLGEKFDYSSEILCEEPGQYAVRGGLIDIYPVNADKPFRIDFFGDEVEEIRSFDPTTQRSNDRHFRIRISSCKANSSTMKECAFFDHLQQPATWIFREPEQMVTQFPLCFHDSENSSFSRANFSKLWSPNRIESDLFVGFSELDIGAGIFDDVKREQVEISSWIPSKDLNPGRKNDPFFFKNETGKQINHLFKLLEKQKEQDCKIVISAGAENEINRIREIIFSESSLKSLNPTFWDIGFAEGFFCSKRYANKYFPSIVESPSCGLVLATSREILGRERSRRPIISRKALVQRRKVDQSLDFSELVDGDFIVHHQHGICRFRSIGKVSENSSLTEESITLEFDDSIMLHLPIQESHLLSRYVGLTKTKPKLAKLGGKAWTRIKSEAERAALDLAADLLRMQANRQANQGFAFSKDDQWQNEFEDSFPFSETKDQQRAIDQVKEDMESEEPMDRLICGDVGFGKTEVAIRAAFKSVMDGKQVALLAPTTILCQQHLNHFRERMVDFPISIEMLNRFRTQSQQRKIISSIKEGSIDILIGTHRLLSNDVEYKDLGLLIIDEEQRFGVQHKEAIKRLRSSIDILTLSATPIPRTLYFAMVGARSISTIESPPVNRRPIRTEVVQYSEELLKRAVDLEVKRNGQIFYLHNRVKTIHSTAKKLKALFPKLKIAIGHGQMKEGELELVMTEFVAKKFHILVCTTIIESGLDIPNCNTIIIEGADNFGLSQLYQLRGRVGRFKRQAYAYLLVNKNTGVTETARKRLSSIRQINNFGAGFQIALRDLELRGAGNLLGSEQSGHVAGVGFEMYCKLLKESVLRLKGDEISLRPKASVRLDFLTMNDLNESEEMLGAFIPDSYIGESRLKIETYRKLSTISTMSEADALEEELMDRFGELPDEMLSVVLEARIRFLAEEAEFDLVETKKKEIHLRYAKKGKNGERNFHRLLGRFPLLKERKPLLKLKEIIQLLKMHIHGKNA